MPPAKRPRFEMNGQQQNGVGPIRPMAPMAGQSVTPGFQGGGIGPQTFPGAPNGSPQNFNAAWQNGGHAAGPGPARMGPMRGGGLSPHPGGPSNMAGPMAASSSGIRAPNMPRGPSRPGRPQAMPNRPMAPSQSAGAGRFNGPVGVNAMTSQGRGGFGRGGSPANLGVRRPIDGLRNGIPSGPSGKGNRFDQSKGKGVLNGKGAANKGSGEVNKIPIGNSRADQQSTPSSKRTFSDFRIKAISIEPIDWQWQQSDEDGNEDDEAGGDEDETMQSSNDVDSANGSIQGSKKARIGKRKEKTEVSKEISKLRICFAANLPPPGAPTGPKALTKAAEKDESEAVVASDVVSTTDEPEWTAFSRGPPQSSTNRISISYASSKRRLVIDSDVIKSIEVNRAEATLKIVVSVTTAAGVKRRDQLEKKKGEEWVIVKGVLLEGREAEMDNFSAISRRELEKCWKMKGEEEVMEEEEEGEQLEEQQTLDPEPVMKTEDDVEAGEVNPDDEEEPGQADEGELGIQSTNGSGEEEKVAAEGPKAEETEAEAAEEAEVEEQEVAWQDYTSLPPFFRLLARHEGSTEDENHSAMNSDEMTITVMLDAVSPKQELRWVKTGDVEEWLSAFPGFQSSFASTSGAKVVHAWTDKIHVVDPDPPPTVADVLQDWASKSFVGSVGERKRFLEVYQLHTTSGMTDVICKLVRGERSVPTPNARELGAPLREAMEGNVFQQSHLTCGIMAIVRLVKEYAATAGVVESAVEARIQEIFMCLPTHQVFRGIDGLLKEHLEKQRLSNAGRAKIAAGAALPAGPGGKRESVVEVAAAEKEDTVEGKPVETKQKGEEGMKQVEKEEKSADEISSVAAKPSEETDTEGDVKIEVKTEDAAEPALTDEAAVDAADSGTVI
jgi:hypothetical protein